MIEPGLKARARRQLASGEMILFTGAGFSRGAVTAEGLPIASVQDLKEGLHRLAFPSTPDIDPYSSLGDLFEVAVSRAKKEVLKLFESRLRIDAANVPDRYKGWFSLPWHRHYTLNIDDLDEAVGGRFSLPRSLRSVSGQAQIVPTVPDLLSVHLNGRLSDFPEVTFSAVQYGQRAARPEVWYQALISDLLNHPIVFVGTVLEEPGLWQYIEMRRQRGIDTIEMRPPSYLVSPSLPQARAALLRRFNINWVQSSEEEFYREVFDPAAVEIEAGRRAVSARFGGAQRRVDLTSLAQLRAEPPPPDLALFLLGRQPYFADLLQGFAITRSFEHQLLDTVQSHDFSAVLISGTAASGKSTTAMRLALALDGAGKRVFVFNTISSDRNVGVVVAAVRAKRPEVLLIDDLDLFGPAAGRLLNELSRISNDLLVIGAIRSSRIQALDLVAELAEVRLHEAVVPDLEDNDISELVKALRRANRLGKLTGLPEAKQGAILRDQCGRQLLVAMYRATSGEQLQDRVYSECSDLSGDARIAYGMVAIATTERQFLLKDEVLVGLMQALGHADNARMNAVHDLIHRNLFLLTNGRELRLRHRWIAETAVEFFIDNGVIAVPLRALVYSLAVKSDPQLPATSRERRLLRRLLNHDVLRRWTSDIGVVREIYSNVEDLLAWDYHYWLQRGSLEVELGDLSLAENFLNSASSLAPNDYRVGTEYAYMLLKKAAKNTANPSARNWASDAFGDLEAAMANRPDDPYPFHVYGSQGLSWARRAPLSFAEKTALVRKLRDAAIRGCDLHPRRTDLKQLAEDLKKEYLLLATN